MDERGSYGRFVFDTAQTTRTKQSKVGWIGVERSGGESMNRRKTGAMD